MLCDEPCKKSAGCAAWALALLCLASCGAPASPSAPAEADTLRSARLFDSIIISREGEAGEPRRLIAVHFDPELGISFTDIGPFHPGGPLPDPRQILAEVDAADVNVSTSSFLSIADRVAEATAGQPPPQRWGYAYEGGQLRLFFDRRATMSGLIVVGIIGALAVAAVIFAVVFFRRLRREQAKRKALMMTHEQQVDAQERERARIAREIHDGPIQNLHALRMGASVQAAGGSADIDTNLTEISLELRAIAEGLRPPSLGRFGLAAALEAHVERTRKRRPDIRISTRLDEDGVSDDDPDRPYIAERARISLFRVAQEALNNAIEHASATRITLALTFDPNPHAPEQVILEVVDDGQGMNGPIGLDVSALIEAGHFGLAGMYERAELLGGTLSVQPVSPTSGAEAHRGTCLQLAVPWTHVSASPAEALPKKR